MKRIFTLFLITLISATVLVAQYNVNWTKTADLKRDLTYEKYEEVHVYRDKIEHAAIAPNASVYKAGYATADFEFAGANISTLEGGSSYLLKYGADGTEAWGLSIFGGSYISHVQATDDNGVLVVGRFMGTLEINDVEGNLTTLKDSVFTNKYPFSFMARYDEAGKLLWANKYVFEAAQADEQPTFAINDLKVKSDKVVFAGDMDGKYTFADSIYSTSQYDLWGIMFLSNLSSYYAVLDIATGEMQQFNTMLAKGGRQNFAYGYGIDCDENNNIYLANIIKGDAVFAGDTIVGAFDDTGSAFEYASTAVISKFNADGTKAWHKTAAMHLDTASTYGQYSLEISGFKLNDVGSLIVAGNFSGGFEVSETDSLTAAGGEMDKSDVFLISFSAENGDILKTFTYGSEAHDEAPLMDFGSDRIFLAAEFDNQLAFNNREIQSYGLNDTYIATLDMDLEPQVARAFGSAENDYLTGLSVLPNDTLIFSASYSGDFNTESLTTSSGEGYDAIIVKMAYVQDFPTTVKETLFKNMEPFLYPNPALDFITVKRANKVIIFNINGSKILEKVNPNQVSVNSLNPGIYFVRLENQNKTKTIKLIKK